MKTGVITKWQQLINDIREWSVPTFGERRNPAQIYHLKEEVDELIRAIDRIRTGETKSEEELREEFADCFMLLLDSAAEMGFNEKALITIIRKKLEKNKLRILGVRDSVHGHTHHVKCPKCNSENVRYQDESANDQGKKSSKLICNYCNNVS